MSGRCLSLMQRHMSSGYPLATSISKSVAFGPVCLNVPTLRNMTGKTEVQSYPRSRGAGLRGLKAEGGRGWEKGEEGRTEGRARRRGQGRSLRKK
eukprot:55624-Rhodomonas_salina.2